MDKSAAIEKVRLLMRLAASAPEHEAANAKHMANKFIEKFALSPEEYEEKEEKPVYTDDDLLFESNESLEWLNILALTIGNKYDCLIIQEENVASTGERVFKYFVYGDPSDVVCAKMLFDFVKKEIDNAVSINCRGRGDLYISSYCEGLVNGVRINIETEDFNIEGLTVAKAPEQEPNKQAIVKEEAPKKDKGDIPIKARVDVNKKEKPLDIIAYFTGEGHGRKIHIGKVMEGLFLNEDSEEEHDDSQVQDYSWVDSLKNLFK